MALNINGTRPELINVNGKPLYMLYIKNEGQDNGTCVWAKSYPLEIVENKNGTIKVERIEGCTNEAPLGEVQTGGLVYAGDYIRVTTTPLNGAIFVQNSVAVEGGKEWLDQTNPTEIGLAPNFLTDTAVKVVVSANIADPPKSWHTIWDTKKTFGASNSTSTYRKEILAPTLYQDLSPELTRVAYALYRKQSSTSTIIASGTQTLDISFKDPKTSVTQYLKAVSTGIQSEVKSAKEGLITYTYYWVITKVEQYYQEVLWINCRSKRNNRFEVVNAGS